ncbi:aa3 type cytochrome c oxidase subunit IV [Loktanella sp. DSM 29012]|uniref:Aa3-type cytochrome c oxidase subunit IV n=1 Tax=Loktanella gaetbuli TaxID=2881335 RepID=A0ABS8BW10_9RHOB|nr:MULTISPECIES: aa3-type cytochrome c oxidase subunit IV [Loktanella]MCB5199905.1 aa3-type cytochrome c oxidase subunit IV [Loktanella gaetbuli]SEQ43845.1 aa3 type cytochrome c oxidase subunit IV [Loktanella sp. DSM 29012]
MSDHKHGEMDTTEHEKTFDWFMWFISRGAVAIIVLLIFLALVNG